MIYETELDPSDNLTRNEFIVNIRAAVNSTAPAIAVIERIKPAHLIYTIRGITQTSASADVTIGTALTTAELFKVEVQQ